MCALLTSIRFMSKFCLREPECQLTHRTAAAKGSALTLPQDKLIMPCSIVIPTKDRPAGLYRAVVSALEALPEGGEVVVVDDGCKIPATQILETLSCETLRILINPGPHGPSGARNYGVQQSERSIIFFLDDDDLILSTYCSRILSKIPDLPDTCGFGFSSALIKMENGPDTYLGKHRVSGLIGQDSPLDDRLAGLGMGFWIKRELFLEIGGLDTNLRVNEDTEFSIRLSAGNILAYYQDDPGVILFYDPIRDIRDNRSITRSSNASLRVDGFQHILLKHEEFLRRHGRFRRKFILRVIKYRSRARRISGWNEFCSSLSPSYENRLIWAFGWTWLRISIKIRNLRCPSVRRQ